MKRITFALIILILLVACSAKSEAPAETPADSIAVADSSAAATPLATFLELGSKTCIPCKMMQPILKEVSDEYQGLVKVEFHDLGEDRQIGQKYSIRVMPTQVFLDADGKEFFRHEGFYPREEIEKMLAEKIGLKIPEPKKATEPNSPDKNDKD